MATAYLREYERVGQGLGGNVPIPVEPGEADQTVSFTGTAGRSAAFSARTRILRITADSIFSYKVGGSTVTATTAGLRWPADYPLDIAVAPGQYVSVIVNT